MALTVNRYLKNIKTHTTLFFRSSHMSWYLAQVSCLFLKNVFLLFFKSYNQFKNSYFSFHLVWITSYQIYYDIIWKTEERELRDTHHQKFNCATFKMLALTFLGKRNIVSNHKQTLALNFDNIFPKSFTRQSDQNIN